MQRLFFALDLDGRIEDDMAAAGERLRGHAASSRARFVARDVDDGSTAALAKVLEDGAAALGFAKETRP